MRIIQVIVLGVLVLSSGFALAQKPSAAPEAATVADPVPSTDAGQPQVADPAAADENQTQMTDIHDIKPLVPVPVPVSLTSIALWVGAVLLAAALAVGTWLLWKRLRGSPMEMLDAILSPEDTAFQKLSALSLETENGKAFYFQLSGIFREYLHGRFGIDGMEMTTEELLPHIDTMPVEFKLRQEVKPFLISCDPVKFAGFPADRPGMEKALEFVRRFVEKTGADLFSSEDTDDPETRD
jgi:hypothetical protein